MLTPIVVEGVFDTSKIVLSALEKYSKFNCYTDYLKMVEKEKPEAVFVATPTKFHYVFGNIDNTVTTINNFDKEKIALPS